MSAEKAPIYGVTPRERIALATKHLNDMLMKHVPLSRERTNALMKLEECMMWAETALNRNGPKHE